MVPLEHPPPRRGEAAQPDADRLLGRTEAGASPPVAFAESSNGRLDASVRRRSLRQRPSLVGASVTMAAT
jgi:hypothetical protein